jgi:hypothetical protein
MDHDNHIESATVSARTIVTLAELPGKSLLDEAALAAALNVTKRTVRRMVARFELPPPISLAGRSTWIAERVIAHLDERAERAARAAEQESRRVEKITHRALRLENISDFPQEISNFSKENASALQK